MRLGKKSNKRGTLSDNDSAGIDGKDLLEKLSSGLCDAETFFVAFGQVKIHYSTPLGEDADGTPRLFIFPDQEDTAFVPVFLSFESAVEFFKKAGRCNYMIMEGSFLSFLETTRSINKGSVPKKLGAIIDPDHYGVTISAGNLDATIALMKQKKS